MHIDRSGASAKFWLQPVALARNIDFRPVELREWHRAIVRRQNALLEAWHGYFGA